MPFTNNRYAAKRRCFPSPTTSSCEAETRTTASAIEPAIPLETMLDATFGRKKNVRRVIRHRRPYWHCPRGKRGRKIRGRQDQDPDNVHNDMFGQ